MALSVSPLGTAALAALAAALLLLAMQVLRPLLAVRGRLPPGPPHSLLTGTAIPDTHPWRTMAEWTRRYGDVCTVRVGPAQLLFVVGTARAAHALLNKQAGVSSGRPRNIMAGELMSGAGAASRRRITALTAASPQAASACSSWTTSACPACISRQESLTLLSSDRWRMCCRDAPSTQR
jgi:hypothetical protein